MQWEAGERDSGRRESIFSRGTLPPQRSEEAQGREKILSAASIREPRRDEQLNGPDDDEMNEAVAF